jgi:hypothetical protein
VDQTSASLEPHLTSINVNLKTYSSIGRSNEETLIIVYPDAEIGSKPVLVPCSIKLASEVKRKVASVLLKYSCRLLYRMHISQTVESSEKLKLP